MTSSMSDAIPAEGNTLRVRIFYSYSAKDEAYQKELETHLAILRRTRRIEDWHNKKILAGEHRDNEIKRKLIEADIILLLLTPNFIDSDYCYSREMAFAIQLHKEEMTKVIPLLIQTSTWENTPLKVLQALPRRGNSIYENAAINAISSSHFESLINSEWEQITREINDMVENLLASPDDLLKKREMRLALASKERGETQQSEPPKEQTFPNPGPESRLLWLVVSVALLIIIFGGAILAFSWMPRGTHNSSLAGLTTIATTRVTAIITASGSATVSTHTFPETTSADAYPQSNYKSGGGNPGPVIRAYKTVQISCKVTGLNVGNGNTWWYRIASKPWNNEYYVSADPFYNNGQTSGPVKYTPFVDSKVPNC